jgi:hypothetical protein
MGVLESIGLFATDIRLEAAIRITMFSVLGFSLHFFVSPVCLDGPATCLSVHLKRRSWYHGEPATAHIQNCPRTKAMRGPVQALRKLHQFK